MCMLLLIIDIKCTIYFGFFFLKKYGRYAIFVLKQNNLMIIIVSLSFIAGKVVKQPKEIAGY